jgi:hypothetical protein
MRCRLVSLLVLGLVGLRSHAATPTELFNGKDLKGWEIVASPATAIASFCHYLPDGALAVSGQPTGFIASTATYENYRLHVEWRWSSAPGNAGVLVHIASGPKDRQWPLCFQIQTKNKSVGDLLPMAGAKFTEPLTSAPNATTPLRAHTAPDSEKPPGEWNACDIVCRGDTIEVTINGVVQNRVSGCAPATGKIGFQLEGTAYELRHVRLSPL